MLISESRTARETLGDKSALDWDLPIFLGPNNAGKFLKRTDRWPSALGSQDAYIFMAENSSTDSSWNLSSAPS